MYVVIGSVAYHVSARTRASDSLLSFLPLRIYGSPLSSSGLHPLSNTRLSGERKKIGGGRGRRLPQPLSRVPLVFPVLLTLPQPLPLNSQCQLGTGFFCSPYIYLELTPPPRVKPNFLSFSFHLNSIPPTSQLSHFSSHFHIIAQKWPMSLPTYSNNWRSAEYHSLLQNSAKVKVKLTVTSEFQDSSRFFLFLFDGFSSRRRDFLKILCFTWHAGRIFLRTFFSH